MEMDVGPVDSSAITDVETLFSSSQSAAHCWCMWFIIAVRDYHAAGGEGNRARFAELANASEHPVGVVGYVDGEPVGWCAVGPRSRYARAIRTPTYAGGRDPAEDERVWLIPCIFVRHDRRGTGMTAALLTGALELARERGALAVEAFPLAAGKRHGKDHQVGFETVFARAGFEVLHRPSPARVLMRKQLVG